MTRLLDAPQEILGMIIKKVEFEKLQNVVTLIKVNSYVKNLCDSENLLEKVALDKYSESELDFEEMKQFMYYKNKKCKIFGIDLKTEKPYWESLVKEFNMTPLSIIIFDSFTYNVRKVYYLSDTGHIVTGGYYIPWEFNCVYKYPLSYFSGAHYTFDENSLYDVSGGAVKRLYTANQFLVPIKLDGVIITQLDGNNIEIKIHCKDEEYASCVKYSIGENKYVLSDDIYEFYNRDYNSGKWIRY